MVICGTNVWLADDAMPPVVGGSIKLSATVSTGEETANILFFLDNVPSLSLPEDLKKYLIDSTKHIGTEQIAGMIASTKKSIEHPDDFLENNRVILEQYLALKRSDEYRNSHAFQVQSLLKEFDNTSGYYDVFLPALKELSPAYAEYCRQMEIANEKIFVRNP